MAEIKIVNVPPALLSKINSLSEASEYADRSAFLVNAINDYCLFHDCYFLHCLPDTIRILAEDAIKSQNDKVYDLLEYALNTTNECNRLMKQLVDILAGEEGINIDKKVDD